MNSHCVSGWQSAVRTKHQGRPFRVPLVEQTNRTVDEPGRAGGGSAVRHTGCFHREQNRYWVGARPTASVPWGWRCKTSCMTWVQLILLYCYLRLLFSPRCAYKWEDSLPQAGFSLLQPAAVRDGRKLLPQVSVPLSACPAAPDGGSLLHPGLLQTRQSHSA